jgi:outer membrane protein TolC
LSECRFVGTDPIRLARLVPLFVFLVSFAPVAAAQRSATLRLTLKQAVELALKNNVGVLIAKTDIDEAAGTRERRVAAFLPHVSADSFVNVQNRNLAVAGLSIPTVPPVVGPYSFMDLRVSASQMLVDREAYHGWKASARVEAGATLSYQDVRDLVIRQAAGLYLASQSMAAEVEAAGARVVTSVALQKLAEDQRDQGLATGLDVVRAQLQLARDRQNLLVVQNAYQTSLLSLARFLGLDLGQPLELGEVLAYDHVGVPTVENEVRNALAARADYQALLAQLDALDEQRQAVRARALPKVSLTGDYGALGRSFDSLPGIGEIQATVSISLFDRDRAGAQQELSGRRERVNAQLADLARGIEQELRKAVLDLASTDEQVRVADATVDLATRELALAEDRFRNGVSDNVEVIAAQDALAQTRDERIAALARHADARMALARARGATEQTLSTPAREP